MQPEHEPFNIGQNYETLPFYFKTISELADAPYTFLETKIKLLGFSASAIPPHQGPSCGISWKPKYKHIYEINITQNVSWVEWIYVSVNVQYLNLLAVLDLIHIYENN